MMMSTLTSKMTSMPIHRLKYGLVRRVLPVDASTVIEHEQTRPSTPDFTLLMTPDSLIVGAAMLFAKSVCNAQLHESQRVAYNVKPGLNGPRAGNHAIHLMQARRRKCAISRRRLGVRAVSWSSTAFRCGTDQRPGTKSPSAFEERECYGTKV